MNPQDLTWLAGLLEGEGSFFAETVGGQYRYPVVEITMTDEDVINRAADLMQAKPQFRHAPAKKTQGHKPTWRARVRGKRAVALMEELLPHMGQRRSLRIEEVLSGARKNRTPAA